MLRCGLLGEKLGHSYSPAIHAMLGDYEYRLYERSPEELETFLKSGEFDGLNVTIPYKKKVMSYCAELSDLACEIGSINVIVRREDGSLYGDNADAFGFAEMIRHSGISVAGKKALVLGSGGASVMACVVLKKLGAADVVVISRSGKNNYENISRHADARIIVNTTPVGMYPHTGVAPVDLTVFPQCEGVLDLIYNPARTALMLQAEQLGIPNAGGLYMLVAQAKKGSESFTGRSLDDALIGKIEKKLSRSMQNVVLIGMPGCGKTTVAALLSKVLDRPVEDSDAWVEQNAKMGIPEIFTRYGEGEFRDRETAALADLGKRSGIILATGGGSVLREENYPLLYQNGTIFWLQRDTEKLAKEGRPISMRRDLSDLYAQRRPCYERFADYVIDNNGSTEETVRQILEVLS